MMDEQQPETLRVHLSRPDSGVSWGFRLQGGVDFNTPLSIQVVQPKSVAERYGVRAGDGIISINNTNTDGLTHEQAKMEIIRSNNDIDMTIIRGAVQIWRPKVTPMSQLRPNELQPIQTATGDEIIASQKTYLGKDKQDETCTIGSSYNRSARPFGGGGQSNQGGGRPQYGGGPQNYGSGGPQYGGGPQNYGGQSYGEAPQSPKRAVPNVVHAQFNTPIGLYSPDNIAKSYSDQTAGIAKEVQNLDVNEAPVGTRMTGTYQRLDSDPSSPQYGGGAPQPSGFRSVTAPKFNPSVSASPKQESMYCNGCNNMVSGVFVRVKGLPYHEKCFKCFNCGLFLKQKGYFMIEGELYCEVHAKMAAQSPGDNMKYAGAVYR